MKVSSTGEPVAIAYDALVRCGTLEQFERDPSNRLRLTVGLRRDGDRWVVTHEHHWFPDKT
jgi:ketosteroid isomerase-like protein